ncbi:hypothetical protein EDB92DRAFT_1902949 [Lactarius akahatsu]|uniref:Uncharacterized protein n=1 Tax=Lactarius akahatsu TaxID=416441 RepID=A0AAD4L679_9AGAM|nr:hypothetical protein EDB92DRAFT_1902949 [Lactarius akahatsu]
MNPVEYRSVSVVAFLWALLRFVQVTHLDTLIINLIGAWARLSYSLASQVLVYLLMSYFDVEILTALNSWVCARVSTGYSSPGSKQV